MTEVDATKIALKAIALYDATHPRPAQVNQIQAAEMLGKSRQTVARMIDAGLLRLNGCGLIPITEIDRVLSARAA